MNNLLSNIIWYSPTIFTISLWLLAALGIYAITKIIIKGRA